MSDIAIIYDFWLFWGFVALTGIIMYYWTKATEQIKYWKLARLLDKMGVYDIEQN